MERKVPTDCDLHDTPAPAKRAEISSSNNDDEVSEIESEKEFAIDVAEPNGDNEAKRATETDVEFVFETPRLTHCPTCNRIHHYHTKYDSIKARLNFFGRIVDEIRTETRISSSRCKHEVYRVNPERLNRLRAVLQALADGEPEEMVAPLLDMNEACRRRESERKRGDEDGNGGHGAGTSGGVF